MQMSAHDFIQQFTRLRQDRKGLVLQEKPMGNAFFWRAMIAPCSP
jgi:hypothetical protein